MPHSFWAIVWDDHTAAITDSECPTCSVCATCRARIMSSGDSQVQRFEKQRWQTLRVESAVSNPFRDLWVFLVWGKTSTKRLPFLSIAALKMELHKQRFLSALWPSPFGDLLHGADDHHGGAQPLLPGPQSFCFSPCLCLLPEIARNNAGNLSPGCNR